MVFKITFLLCLCSTLLFSQNLTGVVYDAEAALSGIQIMNITSKSLTTSDPNGNFKIYAKEGDTLIFSSLFHHTKQVIGKSSHFEATQVFELQKITNTLDEVALYGNAATKPTDAKEAEKTLNEQLKNDVKNQSHKYKPPNTGGLDFIAIGEAIVKLFKRKKPQEPEETERHITSNDLMLLFKKDKFFNDTFLLLDLNITKDYKQLFFAYCETKTIPATLLHPDNQIYLIDRFLDYSVEFQEILKASQKP